MNEIPVTDSGPRKPPLMAGARPIAIVPQSMEEAYRMANAVCSAGMAPAGLDTPEKAMVAILHGLEIGLAPMAALQRIAVVNGRPTIWGDGAIGLVRSSGLCEWVRETISGEGETRFAKCEAKRKGDPEITMRTFSVDDAKRAGLWSPQPRITRFKKDGGAYEKDNDSPWHRYPDRMMQMRARAFVLRDLFADVLGGLYLREEIEDDTRDGRRPPPPAPEVVRAIEHRPALAEKVAISAPKEAVAAQASPRRAPPPPTHDLQPPPIDAEDLIEQFETAARESRDKNGLDEVWCDIVLPVKDSLFPPDLEVMDTIYRRALERIGR